MFLQQTMTPWFAIQRASQVVMILLAITMLALPLLTQPQEAEAADPLTICFIAGCFAIVAAIVGACAWHTINQWANACPGYCGDWGTGEAHRQMCRNGHVYYDCYPNAGWLHATCTTT